MTTKAEPREARHVKVGDTLSRGIAGLWGPVATIDKIGRQIRFTREGGGIMFAAPRKRVHVVVVWRYGGRPEGHGGGCRCERCSKCEGP